VRHVELADVEAHARVGRLDAHPRLAQRELGVAAFRSIGVGIHAREAAERAIGALTGEGFDVDEERDVRRGAGRHDEVERAKAERVVFRPLGIHDPLDTPAEGAVDGDRKRRGHGKRADHDGLPAFSREGVRVFLLGYHLRRLLDIGLRRRLVLRRIRRLGLREGGTRRREQQDSEAERPHRHRAPEYPSRRSLDSTRPRTHHAGHQAHRTLAEVPMKVRRIVLMVAMGIGVRSCNHTLPIRTNRDERSSAEPQCRIARSDPQPSRAGADLTGPRRPLGSAA
jgi:hypothetical protein